MQLEPNPWLMQGDCLERMSEIPDGSVDMVLCDLPYGTTDCKWDSVIPFEPLWAQYRRVCKRNAAIVLTASQPFTSALVMSNAKCFRYSLVWLKDKPSDPLNAKKRIMKWHEDICVFYGELPTFNPQKVLRNPENKRNNAPRVFRSAPINYEYRPKDYGYQMNQGTSDWINPSSVIKIAMQRGLHPTQKPVALMEYLIRTYTNEGETVLDSTMGSGTTGVACANTNRRFIGIERDTEYFKIAENRIKDAYATLIAA